MFPIPDPRMCFLPVIIGMVLLYGLMEWGAQLMIISIQLHLMNWEIFMYVEDLQARLLIWILDLGPSYTITTEQQIYILGNIIPLGLLYGRRKWGVYRM